MTSAPAPIRPGKLAGASRLTLHTEEALRLFVGAQSARARRSDRVTLSVDKFSARTHLVARHARSANGDPVAAEILVNAEDRLQALSVDVNEKRQAINAELNELDCALDIESVSSRPAVLNVSAFNPLGMRAVVTLVRLDQMFLAQRQAVHVGMLGNTVAQTQTRTTSRHFRSIIFTPFLYRASATRDDFDTKSETARTLLAHYRRQHYIRQSDTRNDEDLCLHYASYDRVPSYF